MGEETEVQSTCNVIPKPSSSSRDSKLTLQSSMESSHFCDMFICQCKPQCPIYSRVSRKKISMYDLLVANDGANGLTTRKALMRPNAPMPMHNVAIKDRATFTTGIDVGRSTGSIISCSMNDALLRSHFPSLSLSASIERAPIECTHRSSFLSLSVIANLIAQVAASDSMRHGIPRNIVIIP